MIKLTEKYQIGEYVIEYANFMILIKKNDELIKGIPVDKEFDSNKYTKFIKHFTELYKKKNDTLS